MGVCIGGLVYAVQGYGLHMKLSAGNTTLAPQVVAEGHIHTHTQTLRTTF